MSNVQKFSVTIGYGMESNSEGGPDKIIHSQESALELVSINIACTQTDRNDWSQECENNKHKQNCRS